MVVDGCYRGPDLTEWFSVEPTCAKRYETSSGPEIDGVAGYLGLRFPPGSFRNPRIRWIESQQNRLFCRVLFLAADVQVSRAKLFLLDAQNNEETTMAALDDVLGQENSTQYSLVDETNNHPEPAPDDPEAMVKLAFPITRKATTNMVAIFRPFSV